MGSTCSGLHVAGLRPSVGFFALLLDLFVSRPDVAVLAFRSVCVGRLAEVLRACWARGSRAGGA